MPGIPRAGQVREPLELAGLGFGDEGCVTLLALFSWKGTWRVGMKRGLSPSLVEPQKLLKNEQWFLMLQNLKKKLFRAVYTLFKVVFTGNTHHGENFLFGSDMPD